MKRRQFLQKTAHSLGAFALASTLGGFRVARAQDYKALVCIFLYGGNDSNHLLIPLDDLGFAEYAAVRTPTSGLHIPRANWLPIAGVGQGDRPFGLHPSLPNLKAAYDSRRLAFVANVGPLAQPLTRAQYRSGQALVPDQLFSHLDQQTLWHSALTGPAAVPTGWGGRLADEATDRFPASSGFPMLVDLSGTSLFTRGIKAPSVAGPQNLQGFGTSASAQARYAAFRDLMTLETGSTLASQLNAQMAQGIEASLLMSRALSTPSTLTTVFPSGSLSSQLKTVASLISAREALGVQRQIFFCSLGGFDTHSAQLGAQASLFAGLDGALHAFLQATQELGVEQQVTTFTQSDFGRTFQPTSAGGSDHAWGSHHLVAGGAVVGGQIFGRYPRLILGGEDDADDEGRWIPGVSVSEFAAPLMRWFGATNVAAVLPELSRFKNNRSDLSFL